MKEKMLDFIRKTVQTIQTPVFMRLKLYSQLYRTIQNHTAPSVHVRLCSNPDADIVHTPLPSFLPNVLFSGETFREHPPKRRLRHWR